MAKPKPVYGSFLLSVRITGDRLQYKLARWFVLADVPLKQIVDSPYAGRLLRLRNGQVIRLRGISLDDFANLAAEISALNFPPCGEHPPADNPPLERTGPER